MVEALFPDLSPPVPSTDGDTMAATRSTLAACWVSMGGRKEDLCNRGGDDMSRWRSVIVDGTNIIKLNWYRQNLYGSIPSSLCSLSSLRVLSLSRNANLSGTLPPEIGDLTSLTQLYIYGTSISGPIPSQIGKCLSLTAINLANNRLDNSIPTSLTYLSNLRTLSLKGNNFTLSTEERECFCQPLPSIIGNRNDVEYYTDCLLRDAVVPFLDNGIRMTHHRQMNPSALNINPLFSLLSAHEGLKEHIYSYFDCRYCCVRDRNTLLTCWKKMGGDESKLRRGYGDDVWRWAGPDGIQVNDGRVEEVSWHNMGLSGTIPEEMGALSALCILTLSENDIRDPLPAVLGKMEHLVRLDVQGTPRLGLVPLPREFGENLRLDVNGYIDDGNSENDEEYKVGEFSHDDLVRMFGDVLNLHNLHHGPGLYVLFKWHFSQSNIPWGTRHRSIWIAVSFLAYLPLCRLTWQVYESWFLSFWWILQIYVGAMSDYFTAGEPSIYHLYDRVMAPLSVLVMVLTTIRNIGFLWAMLLAVPPLYLHRVAQGARIDHSPSTYNFAHGLWHVAGSAASYYAMLHFLGNRGDREGSVVDSVATRGEKDEF